MARKSNFMVAEAARSGVAWLRWNGCRDDGVRGLFTDDSRERGGVMAAVAQKVVLPVGCGANTHCRGSCRDQVVVASWITSAEEMSFLMLAAALPTPALAATG